MMRVLVLFFTLLTAVLMLSPVSYANNLEDWYDGIEKDITGHSFDEEYWTSEISNTTEKGDEVKFTISYVNNHNVQVFMIALHSITNPDNGTGTLPYQLFGTHFTTDSGQEVFISALLAFLLIYNDTNNNGIPDPGIEQMLHVIPFGADKDLNGTYPPKVTSITVKRYSDTHYEFGMRYENLYALVTQDYFASAVWKTGWVARFSELTITYNIEFNEDTGEVTTETFYTIGEVTELWAFILGIPIPVDPDQIPDNFGLAVAHYVTVFTSKYQVKGADSGKTIKTDITEPLTENITIDTGTERAFEIGFRGDYTLYDEEGNVAKNTSPAINILLNARAKDLILVLWQLGFSANVFSFMAYGLSDYVQNSYANPKELRDNSLKPFNPEGFYAQALWYVVCFPEWNGYRIEHDPVYTAYSSPEGKSNDTDVPKPDEKACGSAYFLVTIMFAVPAVVIVKNRNKMRY